MESLNQREIARAVGSSPATVTRLLRALYREAMPPSRLDALKCIAVPEIMAVGFSSSLAVQILVEHDAEVRYLADDPARKCWIAFCIRDELGAAIQLSALKSRHLEAIIDAFPLSLILPLHNVIAAAVAKLDAAQLEKARRSAA